MQSSKNEKGVAGFLKSLLGFSIPTWVNFVISTMAAAILTRIFSPDDYGYITIFTATTEFGMSLLCLGMDSGCLRFYHNPPKGEDTKIFLFKTIVSCCLLVVAVCFPVCLFCPRWFANTVFGMENAVLTIVLAINIFSSTILRFFGISYRMKMKTKEYGIQLILTNTIRKLGYILAVFLSPDAITAICVQVVLLLVTVIVYGFVQRRDIFPGTGEIKGIIVKGKFYEGYWEFFKFSLFNAPNYLMQYANNLACLQILRVICGPFATGIYSTTSYFSSALAMMRGGFGTFWAPYMYQNYKEKQETIKFVHSVWMVFSSICFLALLLARDLIYLLVGAEYAAGKEIVSFVLLGSLLQACMETTVYGIYIQKKAHVGMILHAVQIVLCISLSWALAYPLDILGVALGNIISNIIYFALSSYYGQKYYSSIHKAWRTVYTVVALVIEAAAAYCLSYGMSAVVCTVLTASICLVYGPECNKIIQYIHAFLQKTLHKDA